jgi:hypothetical protein
LSLVPLEEGEVLGFCKTDLRLGLSCFAELLSPRVHGSARGGKGIFSLFLVRFGRSLEDGGVLRVAGETGV